VCEQNSGHWRGNTYVDVPFGPMLMLYVPAALTTQHTLNIDIWSITTSQFVTTNLKAFRCTEQHEIATSENVDTVTLVVTDGIDTRP